MEKIKEIIKSIMENKDVTTFVASSILQSTMEQILQMLQQNAIHVDLSEEDMKRMQEQERKILEALELLRIQADDNRIKTSGIYEEIKKKCDEVQNRVAPMYENLEEISHKTQELEAVFAGRKTFLDTCTTSYKEKEFKLKFAKLALAVAEKEAKKQEDLLKTWCWVPGYGTYLALDTLFNDKEVDLRAAERAFEAASEQMVAIKKSFADAQRQFEESQRNKEKIQKEYDQIGKDVEEIQEQLHNAKEDFVHWELILSEVNALYNKVKNASLLPEEIISMQEDLIKLQKA